MKTQAKTIRHYIVEFLPSDIALKAINNTSINNLEKTVKKELALSSAFNFEATPEGSIYWKTIENKYLRDTETNLNKEKKAITEERKAELIEQLKSISEEFKAENVEHLIVYRDIETKKLTLEAAMNGRFIDLVTMQMSKIMMERLIAE